MSHRVSFVLEGNADAVRSVVRRMLDGVGFTEVSFEIFTVDRGIEQIGHDALIELYESVIGIAHPTYQQLGLLHACRVALGVCLSGSQEKGEALRRCSLEHEMLMARRAAAADRKGLP